MPNQLTTRFKFDDADGKKIDALRGKLVDFNDYANRTGSSDFGKKINDNFRTAGRAADDFKTKADNAFTPTISRWTNEAEKATTAVKTLSNAVDTLQTKTTGLPNAGANSIKRIGDSNAPAAASALGKPDNSLYAEIEKSRLAVQNLNKQQIDSGKFNGLTQSGVRLHNELGKVSADVLRINNQLSKTSDKNLITKLSQDLAVADDKLARLNGRLAQYTGAVGGGAAGSSRNLKLSSFQKTNLSYQVNDVLTGLASGQNPTQILAQQGGQIAQIFNPAQITAFTAAYGGLVSILGAGTIAIAATYKITGDLRAEAERRLKVEEKITGAINNQILSQKAALKNQEQLRANAQSDFEFNQRLQKNKSEDLKRERDLLVELNKRLPATSLNSKGETVQNENFARNTQRILELENQLRQNSLSNTRDADAAFNQRNENFKKNQENAREAARAEADRRKKQAEDLEKAKSKIEEFRKTVSDVFDNVYQKTVSNNPIAVAMLEGDRATKQLKDTLKTLPPQFREIGEQAIAMQRELNANALFSASLDNKLNALNLRDEAEDFRSFKSPKITDPAKFFADFIEAGLKQISKDTGGSFIRYNKDSTFGGTFQTDARNDLLYSYDRISNSNGSFGGFSRRSKTFADLTEKEKNDFIRSSTDPDGSNLKFQQKLDRQIFAASNSGALTEEQRRIVDRKIISLTQGIDPSKLTEQQRDISATVREREAERIERNNAEARQLDRTRNEYLKRVAISNEKLIALAGKGGADAVIKFIDETSGGITPELQLAATKTDVQKAYDDAYKGGTFFDEANKQ